MFGGALLLLLLAGTIAIATAFSPYTTTSFMTRKHHRQQTIPATQPIVAFSTRGTHLPAVVSHNEVIYQNFTSPIGEKGPTDEDTPPLDGYLRLQQVLQSVPSRGYVTTPTPIEYMPRLSKAVAAGPNGNCDLYVKRDDMLPLAGGGSKTRKLDYLIQQALSMDSNIVIVTSGAVQSNHCRLTASAAARENLECHLILEERVPNSYDPHAGGNNYIFHLLGAHCHVAQLGGVNTVQEQLVQELQARGKTVYVIPGGGSNELGALGYCRAAAEIIQQSHELQLRADDDSDGKNDEQGKLYWDAIVTCSGSGGTHTGLLTGLRAAGYQTPVLGVSVRFDSETQIDRIHKQCNNLIHKYFSNFDFGGVDNGDLPREEVIVLDGYVGPGYSLYTEEMAEAIQLFARTESILLDPVYTGKGAAGLLSVARTGNYRRILFIHTGGAPSLFHYQTLPGQEINSDDEKATSSIRTTN